MAKKLNKATKEAALKCVQNSYTASLNFQRPLFVNFNEYYQIYRAVREENKQNYAGRAKLYVPYVFSTIETIIPRLVGEKPKIEAIPREASDLPGSKMNTQLFNYEWDRMGMKEKLKYWVKQSLIYGVGIIKVYWRFKEDGSTVTTDEAVTELVDLFDFFIDPNATTIDDARYIIQRAERNIDDLKNNPNYDVPKELISSVQEDNYKVQRDSILGLSKPKDKDSKKVQVLEYWGLFDINQNGKEKECLIVEAQGHIIRCVENPYNHKKKPFVALHDVQIPFSFWSIGEVEQLKSLQYELNDIRNQRMDNVTLILNRMWLVDKNSGTDEEDLVSQAGQVVHTDNINGVKPLDTPDVTTSAYNEETMVKSDMQNVSGVTDYSRGQGDKSSKNSLGNQTATGIMLLQEAGNARFKYKLDNIEDSLVRLGKLLLALNQQFMDKEIRLRIVGTNGIQWIDYNPESIQGEYDVTVAAGSTQPLNKSVRRAEARELLQAVLPMAPLFQAIGLDLKYFIKYLLETYDLTNIDEAFQQIQLPGGIQTAEQTGTGIPSQLNIPNVPTVGGVAAPTPSGNAQNILAGSTIA